jgi:rare lipoprotein A
MRSSHQFSHGALAVVLLTLAIVLLALASACSADARDKTLGPPIGALWTAAPDSERRRARPVARVPRSASRTILASWYGGPGEHLARRTASGTVFRASGFTAAHRTLPFGTRLRVSLGARAVNVVIDDRGPAAWTGRGLDLSRGAARVLGMITTGTALVRVEVLN